MSPRNAIVVTPRELGTVVIDAAARECYTWLAGQRIDLPVSAADRHIDADGNDQTTITLIGNQYVRWE